MPYTIGELHKRLLNEGFPIPEDLARFRQQVWTMTRSGAIAPPERLPTPGSKRGKTGFYADDTLDKIRGLLEERYKGYRNISPNSEASNRYLELLVCVPSPLADLVEGLVEAGYPLDRLIVKGFQWLNVARGEVRATLINEFVDLYDLPAAELKHPKSIFDRKWGFVAALRLAALGFDVAETLAQEYGVSPEAILGEWNFEFSVSNGKIVVSAVTEEAREYQNASVTDDGNS